jgi:hypothetical protein
MILANESRRKSWTSPALEPMLRVCSTAEDNATPSDNANEPSLDVKKRIPKAKR